MRSLKLSMYTFAIGLALIGVCVIHLIGLVAQFVLFISRNGFELSVLLYFANGAAFLLMAANVLVQGVFLSVERSNTAILIRSDERKRWVVGLGFQTMCVVIYPTRFVAPFSLQHPNWGMWSGPMPLDFIVAPALLFVVAAIAFYSRNWRAFPLGIALLHDVFAGGIR